MKIIIQKEYFSVTLETKGEYYDPYQLKSIFKTALEIDGFSESTINQVFNVQNDIENKVENN